jgi:flavodoxin
MKTLVLYSTKTGNTQKIARAIAAETNSELVQVSNPSLNENVNLVDYDLIFVGTGIRAGNPFHEMVSYLNTINLPEPKTFAIFLTWGGAGKTNETVSGKVRKILESKNQNVVDGFFSSYGKWNMRKSSRPNENDINQAKIWAQNTIKNL